VAFTLKYAFEAGYRTDDEADILTTLALQDSGTHLRHRVGACERGKQRGERDTEGRESHEFDLRVTN
jgi:hypothetical protein